MTSLDLTWAVRGVDSLLRQRQGIAEIADDPECIFRVSVAVAHHVVTLSDGASIAIGEPVVRLHYWNEHMPAMPRDGPNAAWANLMVGRIRYSLGILAARMAGDRRFAEAEAIQAAPAFAYRFGNAVQLSRICERFGFEVLDLEPRSRLAGRIHDILDGMLIWGLIWAFNPGALKNHGLSHRRIQIWMSRRKLVDLYGGSPAHEPGERKALIKDVEPI
ncbi:MAG: YkoP family protein [Stellaceae bacterium]